MIDLPSGTGQLCYVSLFTLLISLSGPCHSAFTAKLEEKKEAKIIEFLAEWVVTLLSPAQIVKARASHLAFMFVKEYWFREFYLGLKVTASLGREESYTRIIDGQVRCITQEQIQKRGQHMERRIPHNLCSCVDDPDHISQPTQRMH